LADRRRIEHLAGHQYGIGVLRNRQNIAIVNRNIGWCIFPLIDVALNVDDYAANRDIFAKEWNGMLGL